MSRLCPHDSCGNKYERLGQHWAYKNSHRPEITDSQHEIISGSVMSDGCVPTGTKNPFLQIKMKSENYLEYLNKELEPISTGVSKSHQEGMYTLRTVCHPEFKKYRKWYNSGEKVWPENIELTPTTLKHLYCGDGTYFTHSSNANIKISMSKESGNNKKIKTMFRSSGLPVPAIYEGEYNGVKKFVCRFTIDESEELFEYMGKPLPDFKYKWPDKKT